MSAAFAELPFHLYPGENLAELQKRFASIFARTPNDPKKAAFIVFPGPENLGRALQAASIWPHDPVVRALVDAIWDGNEEDYLPTKEQVAREILTLAQTARATDERLKAYDLYGKYMGFTNKDQKPPPSANPLGDFFDKLNADGRPKPTTAD